jgi:hypothetical protein
MCILWCLHHDTFINVWLFHTLNCRQLMVPIQQSSHDMTSSCEDLFRLNVTRGTEWNVVVVLHEQWSARVGPFAACSNRIVVDMKHEVTVLNCYRNVSRHGMPS